MSLLCGALTHLVWDTFTHTHVPGITAFSRLKVKLFAVGTYHVYGYEVLQYGSTVVGLALLLIWFWRWLMKASPCTASLPVTLSPAGQLAVIVTLAGHVDGGGGMGWHARSRRTYRGNGTADLRRQGDLSWPAGTGVDRGCIQHRLACVENTCRKCRLTPADTGRSPGGASLAGLAGKAERSATSCSEDQRFACLRSCQMAVTFGCVLSQASQQTFSDKRSQASVTHFAPLY